MTISNINIINQVNTRLADYATASPQSLCSLTTAADFLKKAAVHSVPTLADLPAASENVGRMIYVEAIESYRYSNGTTWTAQYISDPVIYDQVWAWGAGALGDNTIINKSSPVSVVGGFTDWCQVSAGFNHNAAVRTNGTLWAWGRNGDGQLGDNTVLSNSSPVSVVGGFSDWCQVSSSAGSHTTAIRSNGTLWAWGQNTFGQLGNSGSSARSSPASVVGGFTNWCQVSAGYRNNAAVQTNGTLWTWGSNVCGSLGNNSIDNTQSPVSVVGGFSDWCQVSAGNNHAAAVRSNGTLWAWGRNTSGQLGDDTSVNKSSPISVVGGFCDWCQVSTGLYNTAAVRTTGTLWAWGYNTHGQLGDNTIVSRSSPVSVVGGLTDWCQVSANFTHTAAIRTNGSIWTWGQNTNGQLGDNTIANKSSPVSVVGGFTNWCQVSAGRHHTAAIITNIVQGFNTPV